MDLLAKTFGCCRYVYNWALRQKTDAYYQRGERLSSHDLSLALTALKQQVPTSWLNEVASVPMQQALRHLDRAFLNFFEGRAKYPTFKKKLRQLEHKAKWYGRTLVKIDKWYPSSKRCHACGHLLDSLSLDVRYWVCPECGVAHDFFTATTLIGLSFSQDLLP